MGLLVALPLSLVALWMLMPLINIWHVNSGHDFLLLYAAASAVREGRNPYDHIVLLQQAVRAGIPRHYLLANGQLNQPNVYPPLFAWLVSPLTYLGPKAALLVWRLLSAASVFLGMLGLTAAWTNSSASRPFGGRFSQMLLAAFVTVSPLAVYVIYWGNPVVLVFAAMGGWCWLLSLKRPMADISAGGLMTVALLKPQLAVPLAIIALFCLTQGTEAWPRRRRVALAFIATSIALVLLDIIVTGPALLWDWPRSVRYLSGMIFMQPDMPSLIGLLRPTLLDYPTGVQYGALYLSLLLGMVAAIVFFRRLQGSWAPMPLIGLLTLVWCFAAPYAHANDELLLVPAGLAVLATGIALLEAWGAEADRRALSPVRVARGGIVAVVAILALYVLWRGGFFDADSTPVPPLLRPMVIPILLFLALGIEASFPHGEKAEAQADALVLPK